VSGNVQIKIPKLDELNKKLGFKGIIRTYLKVSEEIREYLKTNPDEHDKFQNDLNQVVDSFSLELARFEKENIEENEKRVYKLKRFFIRRLRKYFIHGHYITNSLEKPYGYAGDFKIIDDIYHNRSPQTGYSKMWDNYFLRMGPSISTRNRRQDFKKIIIDFIKKRDGAVRIMDLASGPCRELKELFDEYPNEMKKVKVDCYDFDDHAIAYAKNLMCGIEGVQFFKKNALRMAIKKNIKDDIPYEYDFIFSTGLFDYLNERVATKLVTNLKKVLRKDGVMCISNYGDKEKNPWAHLMEWVCEWDLIYRTEDEFKDLFVNAGFSQNNIEIQYEPLEIMQYCLAKNE